MKTALSSARAEIAEILSMLPKRPSVTAAPAARSKALEEIVSLGWIAHSPRGHAAPWSAFGRSGTWAREQR